jgi:GTP-binding protein EngB required for normal cell division
MNTIAIVKFARHFQKLSQAKPKLYFLIGPPAVGKSTWINQNASDAAVCNRL